MMKTRALSFLAFLAVVAMIVPAFVGCTNRQNGPKMVERKVTVADSLVWFAANDRNFSRMMELCDSLEKTGDFSHIRANFYRGDALRESGSDSAAFECYRAAVGDGLEDYGELWCYQEAARHYIKMMYNKADYEGVVHEVIPILNILDSVETVDPEARLMIHSMLGECNLNLKQMEFAKQNFEISYKGYQEWVPQDSTGRAVFCAIEDIDNIAQKYITDKMYDEAEVWLQRADSLLPALKAYAEQWDNDFIYDSRYSVILCHHMEIAQHKGNEKEAEKYYEEFITRPFANTDIGHLLVVDYLMESNRYAEAADNLSRLDCFYEATGTQMTMDNLASYIDKMKANLVIGRKDTVLYAAKQLIEKYKPTLEREKELDAARLATIYDTQGKERQISQQQAELLQQRVVGLIIAIILLTIFFIIYTLVRRRAAKRLAEMKAAQERIESELRIARDIQMSMVPSVFPDREGLDMYASMTPAKEVGGDLYGYVLIGDKLYFCVGDVSGKGVPASLFMAQATRLFRTLAAQQMMPAEICTRMNDALSGEDNESSMFVTFFLGLVNLKTGHLDFCNAGHNPPVLFNGQRTTDRSALPLATEGTQERPQTTHCEFLQMEPNAPIGMWPGLEYEGEEIENIRDKSLFIYTDGLTEAEDIRQQQLGDDRLLELLAQSANESAQQTVERLTEVVKQHRGEAEPNDDLTMMCFSIKG